MREFPWMLWMQGYRLPISKFRLCWLTISNGLNLYLVEMVMPGQTGCLQCFHYTMSEEGTVRHKSSTMVRAALPTVELTAAGLLAQSTLKYLLEFGDVTPVLFFDSLKNTFSSAISQPSLTCPNQICKKCQKEFQKEFGRSTIHDK